MITLDIVLFFIFAAVSLVSAFAMIFSRNAVHSALFLLLNFAMLACIYVLMSAQFIAAVQVIVYAGAIVVLILFVVMLLGAELGEYIPTWLTSRTVISLSMGLALLTITATAISENFEGNNPSPDQLVEWGTAKSVGIALFTDYVLPFELTGVLLTIGIVGVVILGGWINTRIKTNLEESSGS